MCTVWSVKRIAGRFPAGWIAGCLLLLTGVSAYAQVPGGPIGGPCTRCGRFVWGSYDAHDCPAARNDSQSGSGAVDYRVPAREADVQANQRSVVWLEPPSQFERQKELSRELNANGIECLNRGDHSAAMRSFQQAIDHWSENTEARLNLQLASDRLSDQIRRALEQKAKEAAWANQLAEQQREIFAAVTSQFRQAEDKRRREESQRKTQEVGKKIDRILERCGPDFDRRGGGDTGVSASGPGLDFQPAIELDQSFHDNPMVVDARHATGAVPPPPTRNPIPLQKTAKKPRNPRTTALLDALVAGGGNWSVSVAKLKERIQKNPADTAARDAYHFTIGLSAGLNEREQRFPADSQIYSIPSDTGPQVKDAAKPALQTALSAVQREDYGAAWRAFKDAHQADPSHGGIRDLMNLNEGLAAAETVDAPELSQEELMGLFLELIQSPLPPDPPDK